MYEYKCVIRKIIDGDTVDVDIDLGFGIWLKDQRIRLYGIDTPECRTRDAEEKIFGLAAKNFVISNLPVRSNQILKTMINKDGEDVRGKFGRILGDFTLNDNATLVETMIQKGFGVEYTGQSKDLIEQAHLAARKRLISSGIVTI